ncbi:MAG: DUF167 domain-containing protein [Sphingobium sp.]|nr:DUF167 domain-containing protein [Sphingobium sp.]
MTPTFWRTDGEDALLAIRLTPRSAKEQISGLWQDEKGAVWLQVQVRAVPEKGRANDALLRLLAKALHIPAKTMKLDSGDTSRLKRVRLIGKAQEVADLTKEWMKDDNGQAD